MSGGTKNRNRDPKLRVALLNPCSVCNKPLLIRDLISDNNLDILALTETFQLTDSVVAELLPPGYGIAYNLRLNGRKGGGVALVHRDNINCSTLEKYNLESFQAITVKLTLPSTVIHVCVVD